MGFKGVGFAPAPAVKFALPAGDNNLTLARAVANGPALLKGLVPDGPRRAEENGFAQSPRAMLNRDGPRLLAHTHERERHKRQRDDKNNPAKQAAHPSIIHEPVQPVGGCPPTLSRSGRGLPPDLEPVQLEPVGGCPPTLSRSNLSRSGVEPPTGTIHPRQISACDSEFGKTSAEINFLIDSYFLSVVPLLSRGWIVPVGGSTPDRQIQPPTGTDRPGRKLQSGRK